jgi:hypothetical protein
VIEERLAEALTLDEEEVGGTDRLNRGSGWARGGRRFGGRRRRRGDGRW